MLFFCLRKIPIRTFSHGRNHMSITFEKEPGGDGSWGWGLGKRKKGRVKIRHYFDDVCQYIEHWLLLHYEVIMKLSLPLLIFIFFL